MALMDHQWKSLQRWMEGDTWRWALGLMYILAVATIWIAASYIVQSVVDSGVSPFLITYICNSLFVIYLPIIEIARYFEDSSENFVLWFKGKSNQFVQPSVPLENVNLLDDGDDKTQSSIDSPSGVENTSKNVLRIQDPSNTLHDQNGSIFEQVQTVLTNDFSKQVDSKGRWTRSRVAKVSILICPFWFCAQLTFNLSLKYTTVTSNTILSSTSSLFTFLVALAFLGEKFTWVKLVSVLLCMGGTIIVSLADSSSGVSAIATNPLVGDILALISAILYSVYITLIRKKLPDEKKGEGQASTAQFLGFIGLFNFVIFFPVALFLNVTRLEPFHKLSWKQFGLIVGKGLMDNVFSDYLWVKATHLTSTTVATAGLTIQVPIAAVIDTLTGQAPKLFDYIGAVAVMIGFAGINIPSDDSYGSQTTERGSIIVDDGHLELVVANEGADDAQ